MERLQDSPCGQLVPTLEGQRAFVPAPLPRHIEPSIQLMRSLEEAVSAVANLAGVGETMQNPQLLIGPFVRREAVLSSRIEGTQASISDLFRYEASGRSRPGGDVREVANYVEALEKGLELLEDLPISLRLNNQLHTVLMRGVRGGENRPGELRDGQVWIGPPGTSIQEARYIPPPADLVRDLLSDWERFANESNSLPALFQCAMMHYQFEAIHPYRDGNGRIGRLLIPLFLCERGVLPKPLLYLSAYFERDRSDYYDQLFRVSATGDWETWIVYFLRGVAEQARDAQARVRQVRELQEQKRQVLLQRRESANALRLLDEVFARLVVTAVEVSRLLDITPAGARRILERLVGAGVLEELGDEWPRLYVAMDLLDLIEAPTVLE
ncbi:MAG: Fic family protein [Chloroflexota bacterium]|nr:Fic family protein [Chloroflexota bacterium]MDE2941044.1 Fic family protein [Chloroflexota bacterium]